MTELARRAAGDRERDRAAGEDEVEVRAAAVREPVAEWAVAQAKEAVAAGWAASLPEWAATASVRRAASSSRISAGHRARR